jgi:hypothetical protein
VPLIEVAGAALPPFRDRLYFISRGVIDYAQFEPVLLRLKGLMERVVRATSRQPQIEASVPLGQT